MFEKFLDWYKKYILICNKKYEEYLLSLSKKITESEIELQKIIDYRMNTNLSTQSELDSKIKIKNDEIADLRFRIVKIKEIREEMVEDLSKRAVGKIYNKILRHPKVAKIIIDGSKLNVITKKISIEKMFGIKRINIGHYKFTYIPENNIFHIRNLEYVVDDRYDHWHVQYGDPCLAYWRPILQKYLDTYQIFFFIDTLIHYLLLSDSQHAYLPFESWIKKFQKKEKIPEKLKEQGGMPTDATEIQLTQAQLQYQQDYATITYQTTVPVNQGQAVVNSNQGWVVYGTGTNNSWSTWTTSATY